MAQFKGANNTYKPNESRRDTRRLTQRLNEFLYTPDGAMVLVMCAVVTIVLTITTPFAGEMLLLLLLLFFNRYLNISGRVHDMPWRVPLQAKLPDGSINLEVLKINRRKKKDLARANGAGVTYLGFDREAKLQTYSSNPDDRAHMVVLGTTGSGKTEYLLGLVANTLIQNSGFIYCDAKGDPSLQREIYRLTRRFGRDADLLTINFITSGRDLIKAQEDKITNTMNMMSNSSSGMLIELIINLLDDSSGGGDMWKGRAMAFIAALTRPLVYLRDIGQLQLSPSTYIEYMELSKLEEFVFGDNSAYGEIFQKVLSPLRSYLITLPGYDINKMYAQESKTVEQAGFITMQLTRAINDLTYNYGHIFGVEAGDVDIYDVVLNCRCMTVLLPALERTPDSLKMLGKLIIGSVKQLMAGCLGNKIEGVARKILDSRPVNSTNAYKIILDEVGYMMVAGMSVMPAQARSLSFSMVFASQDYSDLKRANEGEASAIWANASCKVIGRVLTGSDSETFKLVTGLTGQQEQAKSSSLEFESGMFSPHYRPGTNIQREMIDVLHYGDIAAQENGEFTLLFAKKTNGGISGGVHISRVYGFYAAGKGMQVLRLNDLCPILRIDQNDLMHSPSELAQAYLDALIVNPASISGAAEEGKPQLLTNGGHDIMVSLIDVSKNSPAEESLSKKILLAIKNLDHTHFKQSLQTEISPKLYMESLDFVKPITPDQNQNGFDTQQASSRLAEQHKLLEEMAKKPVTSLYPLTPDASVSPSVDDSIPLLDQAKVFIRLPFLPDFNLVQTALKRYRLAPNQNNQIYNMASQDQILKSTLAMLRKTAEDLENPAIQRLIKNQPDLSRELHGIIVEQMTFNVVNQPPSPKNVFQLAKEYIDTIEKAD